MKTVREQIVDLLIEVEREQSYAQLSLKNALEDLDSRDKALATEIFYGTLKYEIQLDYWINQYSKTPVRKMKPLIRNLLRMSVYQMIYLDKIPSSAIINEAVKIAKKRKFQGLSGFVNGLLRNIDRERENLSFPDPKKSLSFSYSIQYALPEWIIEMWLEQYSKEEVAAICEALNKRAEVCGRCNTLKGDKEALIETLKAEGVVVEPGRLLDEAFYVRKLDKLQNLASFKVGAWTVQDESAMLVAHVVAPQKGDTVLDMCSAPGGKSVHMAALMENKGNITSCDVHPHKLELIEKNAKRLGISIISPTLQDGTVLNETFVGKFDKVLLDAPCSGLGIMKRKPDIRHNKTKEDLEDIASIQRAIVKNAVQYLKPNGRLVYSTCTISYEENEKMAHEIAEQYGLELEDIVDTIPKCLKDAVKEKGMIQILPQMADTDGFFIASFRKGRL